MQSQRKILSLGRLISIKVDSRYLSKIILRSLRLVYKYFPLIKKPVPRWVLFVSLKQKAKSGMVRVFIPILCSLKPIFIYIYI